MGPDASDNGQQALNPAATDTTSEYLPTGAELERLSEVGREEAIIESVADRARQAGFPALAYE